MLKSCDTRLDTRLDIRLDLTRDMLSLEGEVAEIETHDIVISLKYIIGERSYIVGSSTYYVEIRCLAAPLSKNPLDAPFS